MSSSNSRSNKAPSKQQARTLSSHHDQADEAGGVRLPTAIEEAAGSSTSKPKRKRKVRKVDKDLGSSTSAPPNSREDVDGKGDDSIGVEVRALKDKVSEIEAQVQAILLRPAGPTKSARRRARHQKVAVAALEAPAPDEDKDDSEETAATLAAKSELQELQQKLRHAEEEFVALKERRQKHEESSDPQTFIPTDEVEEISRQHGPALMEAQRPRPLGRSVTLSGSYRIPIPVNVTDTEFEAISRGINSAQKIARSFMDASAESRRANDCARPDDSSRNSASWSEWIGGYSLSIAKAVDRVRISSSMETTPKHPTIVTRADTAPSARRKPQKLELRGKKKPGSSERQRGLDEKQVAGLLA